MYKSTIIPYLNKDLKFKLENGQDAYPLYFRVTYMRQTTLIRSINEKRYSELKLDNEEIQREIKELFNLIYFLSECNCVHFNLNGLKEKYLLSQHTLMQAFDTIFRNKVSKNKEKIKDPMLQTLNVGEYSPKYPLHLLVTAVNEFYPKHTKRLFSNCFNYFEMVKEWIDYFPMKGDNQPRLVEFFTLEYSDRTEEGFLKFLTTRFKDEKKAIKFHRDVLAVIEKYILQEF